MPVSACFHTLSLKWLPHQFGQGHCSESGSVQCWGLQWIALGSARQQVNKLPNCGSCFFCSLMKNHQLPKRVCWRNLPRIFLGTFSGHFCCPQKRWAKIGGLNPRKSPAAQSKKPTTSPNINRVDPSRQCRKWSTRCPAICNEPEHPVLLQFCVLWPPPFQHSAFLPTCCCNRVLSYQHAPSSMFKLLSKQKKEREGGQSHGQQRPRNGFLRAESPNTPGEFESWSDAHNMWRACHLRSEDSSHTLLFLRSLKRKRLRGIFLKKRNASLSKGALFRDYSGQRCSLAPACSAVVVDMGRSSMLRLLNIAYVLMFLAMTYCQGFVLWDTRWLIHSLWHWPLPTAGLRAPLKQRHCPLLSGVSGFKQMSETSQSSSGTAMLQDIFLAAGHATRTWKLQVSYVKRALQP